MAFHSADHQKWCHGSSINKEESTSWSFLDLQVWAPAWTACERENQAPDVFLSISNESLGGANIRELLFNPVVILAVVAELARQEPALVTWAVSALRKVTSSKLIGHRRRPWGKAFGSSGFTNSIQDLAVSGLFRPSPRHKREMGVHLFAEEWEPVSLDDISAGRHNEL